MIELESKGLSLSLSDPTGEDAYYQGTRFDRSGAFASIKGWAEEWFDDHTRTRHDHICGCPEEFGPIALKCGKPLAKQDYNSLKDNFDESDGLLKIGVGLIDKPTGTGYERFGFLRLLDPGKWTVRTEGRGSVIFTHVLEGFYSYTKRISMVGDSSFEIVHSLKNLSESELVTDCYDHNFFTLGRQEIDSDRKIDFPFAPMGQWRSDTVSASFEGNGIRFSRRIMPGEKAWINFFPSGGAVSGKIFTLSGNGLSVSAFCDRPVTQGVFWSNHRVACVEPYIDVRVKPGGTMEWTLKYLFNKI